MRAAALLGVAVLIVAAPIEAQRAGGRGTQPSRAPVVPPAEARARAIRAELAEVLLHSQRYSEAAREYGHLVAADSTNTRYRLGLAQALAWGGRYRDAERELKTLAVARPRDAVVDTLLRTVRQSMKPRAHEAAAWVREQPRYAPYRVALARALVREGQLDAALAQNDTLLLLGRSPTALIERARIDIARGDLDAAVTDLSASIATGPTLDGYLTLGDVHRWRGEYSSARAYYENARALSPSSRDVAARFSQLARDERPAVVFGTPIDVQAGWRTSASVAADKVGTQYSTVSAHRGFSAPFAVIGSAGVEIRNLRESLPLGDARTTGYAADVALARGMSVGPLDGELSAMGGVVHHPGAGSAAFGAVAITGRYYAWTASVELAGGPAYPSLMTTAFLTASDDGDSWLSERTVTGSLAGPIGGLDAGISVRRSAFSDGNERTAVQAYGRYPISPRVSAIYSGNAIAFANRSPLYWDPDSHVANALGVQVADRRRRGLSYSASILPGAAWSEDSPYVRASSSELDANRLRLQIAATGELVYRGDRWEVAAAYGWGRLGNYERSDARIGVRFVP